MTDETSIDKALNNLMKRVKTKTKVAKARCKPAETTDYKMTGLIWYDFTKELESASTSEPNRPKFDANYIGTTVRY
ncbi:hypothetical protein BCV53_19645 (plasmid) [Parageobacillus thermoglucosidasius]|uniref:Uncharacterized protein n=1 Tax=Parageobacillus thermoglucosidasius TaxID=1426 RepID=A0AAN1D8H5_PARTM|nr:hypothetical protein BCV53_19645 [Parageobacillus thermoglucosidasius]APM83044.1 hypothetical protein BCV54_19665 [Parageobacillus thermoglucosidasius]KJX67597.1 hypothetical protein WH82_16945 [Parageobacillus thermoglucosidasius]